MVLPLLFALFVQTSTSLETPGIILTVLGDTAFVTPTKSIDREGPIRRATLVEIHRHSLEEGAIVRRDSMMELDCAESRVRVLATQEYDDRDRKRATPQQTPGTWSSLDEADTPRIILHAWVCSDGDLIGLSYESLATELSRIRAGLR